MKKAEAISILAASVRPREAKDRARYDEAVKMAIEALKSSEIPNNSERIAETTQIDHTADIGKKVSISCSRENDLISRQATIDLVGDWIYNPEDLRYHKDVINSIPAAQPEIVRCKDCKHWDTEWSVSESGAHYCPMVDGNRNSDFYCADAERRTDG